MSVCPELIAFGDPKMLVLLKAPRRYRGCAFSFVCFGTGLAALIQKMLVLPKALRRAFGVARHFHSCADESKLSPLRNKNAPPTSLKGLCAQNWIRTSTSLRTLRPEHSASTNFAIWAFIQGCKYNQEMKSATILFNSRPATPANKQDPRDHQHRTHNLTPMQLLTK